MFTFALISVLFSAKTSAVYIVYTVWSPTIMGSDLTLWCDELVCKWSAAGMSYLCRPTPEVSIDQQTIQKYIYSETKELEVQQICSHLQILGLIIQY